MHGKFQIMKSYQIARHAFLTLLTAGALAGLSSCANRPITEEPRRGKIEPIAEPGDNRAGPELGTSNRESEKIARDVREALKLNARLADDPIDVEYSNGVAWLSGEVDSIREKELATEIADRVAGVARVDNRLQADVVAQGESDAEAQSEETTS